jgi:hypothetical protein
MKKSITAFFLIVSIQLSFAQKEFAAIEAKYPITDLLVSSLGDSLFLTFSQLNLSAISRDNFNSFWIAPDGTEIKADLIELYNKSLCGISRNAEHILYYFFEEKKNNFFVNALIQNSTTGKKQIPEGQMSFPGKLLASYVDKDLFLISAEKNKMEVTISRIQDLKLVEQKIFQLPFELLKNRPKEFSLISNGLQIMPAQATSLTKIIKTPGSIFIILDEPANEINLEQRAFKTTVVELDLIHNSSVAKYFFEPTRENFRSMIFGDKVYRYTTKTNPELGIYHFKTGKLIKREILPVADKSDSLQIKSGKTTYSKLAFQTRSSWRPFICVDSIETNLIVTVGEEVEHDPVRILANPLTPGSFGLAAGSALLRAFNDDVMSYYFSYLKGNAADGFKRTAQTGLMGQRIDAFETSQGNKDAKIKSKLYVNKPDAMIAVYIAAKKNLFITKFNK